MQKCWIEFSADAFVAQYIFFVALKLSGPLYLLFCCPYPFCCCCIVFLYGHTRIVWYFVLRQPELELDLRVYLEKTENASGSVLLSNIESVLVREVYESGVAAFVKRPCALPATNGGRNTGGNNKLSISSFSSNNVNAMSSSQLMSPDPRAKHMAAHTVRGDGATSDRLSVLMRSIDVMFESKRRDISVLMNNR